MLYPGMDDDTVTLGGNIQLSGFGEVDPADMMVLRKIIGTRAKQFSKKCKNMELLKLTMKKVHGQERSEKYEVHVMIIEDGSRYTSTTTERNLFFAVDGSLKKIESEIGI